MEGARSFNRDESGVTAIEYSLIAATTGLSLVATLPLIESNLVDMYQQILDYFAA
jgi:Flp pilus assembly pilin Flp